MLRPKPLLKFNIIVPSEHEDRVVEALVKTGMVYVEGTGGISLEIPRELLLIAERRIEVSKIDVERIVPLIKRLGGEATELVERSEKIRAQIRNLKRMKNILMILSKIGLRTDSLGCHEPLFVIAGVISKDHEEQLLARIKELGVNYNSMPLDERETVVVIYGLSEDYDVVYKVLNDIPTFTEISFPSDISPNVSDAQEMIDREISRLREELVEIISELVTQLREAEERERLESIALFEKFLDLYEKYQKLALRIMDISSQEGIEAPYELKRALKREVPAERVKREQLVEIITKYSESFEELNSNFERITSTLRTLHELEGGIRASGRATKALQIRLEQTRNELIALARDTGEIIEVLTKYEPYIRAARYVKGAISRLRILRKYNLSIISGWIPSEYSRTLELTVKKLVPEVISIKIDRPTHEDKVPVYVESKGILKYFMPLTFSRDIPSYWEINPMPFFTCLFLIMYGMMFGDLGLGPLLIVLGFIIYRMNRSFLGISIEGTKMLGILMIFGGISSAIFGVLYGVAFLKAIFEPVLVSPLHDIYGIVKVALIFGVVQLIIAMVLNIINSIIEWDIYEMLLSGRGLVGLVYYICGIYIAIVLAQSNFNWAVLSEGTSFIITLLAVSCMIVVMLGPLYNFFTKKTDIGSCLMKGITEVLEMLIAYPANSLSYIRLAAFAIAHESFGLLAESLASVIGPIPSFLVANILVLGIEGFAVGIQALRLVYYEFSTKFLRGGGRLFKPIIYKVKEEISSY